MNDDQMRELFGEMRGEAVPAESLARVRRAVGDAVERRRRVFGTGWKIAVLFAAAGCLAVVMLRVHTAVPVQAPAPQAPVAVVEQNPPVEVPPPAVVHKPVRAAAKPVRHVEAAPIVGGASEIRIESEDEPDVVIVLIGG